MGAATGRLRLGTRASPLARAQAELVRAALAGRHAGLEVELVFVRTTGDRLRGPLAPAGGKGLFVKEIEEALAEGHVDAGVHSMKDLPARLAPGLVIGAVPERVDPRDVLVGGAGGLAGLPEGARVGTASPRRRAQLLARRPDLEVVLLRGNVDTRLRKWRTGEVDALVLAAAGLARLGIVEPAARPLAVEEFLPAVGQGERAFLTAVGGDCNTALAAHATVADGQVSLRALVADPDGRRQLEDRGTAASSEAAVLGRTLAERLLAAGAAALIGR
ncbi:MAG: hydroxymethylbilane synthase [Deltaproteobacteria bacterium]|nr:MAG: hydroxymethylbilane synthase [Deltaproteobacteria bacterium]